MDKVSKLTTALEPLIKNSDQLERIVASIDDSEKMTKEFKALQSEVMTKHREFGEKFVSNTRNFGEHKRRMDEIEAKAKEMTTDIKELQERPIASMQAPEMAQA